MRNTPPGRIARKFVSYTHLILVLAPVTLSGGQEDRERSDGQESAPSTKLPKELLQILQYFNAVDRK